MSFSRIDEKNLNHIGPLSGQSDRNEMAARRAATEFESILLSQLTASLNPKDDEEEEGLFSGGANGLYRQMFSEQLAKTMAENGGIGLADAILHQLNRNTATEGARGAARVSEIVRSVRDGGDVTHPKETHAGKAPITLREVAANPGAPSPHEERVELQIPLEGRISSRFGRRRDPISGRHRQHAGVDIAAPRGTEIAAAAAGTVVFAGRRGGYGNMVEIEHADGRRTRYAHADRLLVTPGDEVQD